MKTLIVWFATWVLCCLPAVGAGAQDATNSGSVSSQDQIEGVTAGAIGSVNIYGEEPRSIELRKLVAAMVNYNRAQHDGVAQLRNAPGRMWFFDENDPDFKVNSRAIQLAVVIAGPEEVLQQLAPNAPVCRFGQKRAVGGIAFRIADKNSVEMEVLPKQHPFIEKTCRPLGVVLGTFPTSDEQLEISRLDVLSRGSFVTILVFSTASHSELRDYWMGLGLPPSRLGGLMPAADEEILRAGLKLVNTGKATLDVPEESLAVWSSNRHFSRAAENEFGPVLHKVQDLWVAYLNGADIRKPVYRASDIGGEPFWADSQGAMIYVDRINCTASKFLVEKKLTPPTQAASYAVCAEMR